MFVDFDKVFNEKPQTQIKVPEAVVQYLNSKLPPGVKYEMDAAGNCVITGDGGPWTIGGIEFCPSEEQRKLLGEKYTYEDFFELLYNTQQPMPFILKKRGVIAINGKEMAIDRLNFNPHNQIHVLEDSFELRTAKFPPPFEIEIGSSEYQKRLMVERKPYESVTVSKFKSVGEDAISICYYLDKKKEKLSLEVSLNLEKATTVEEIVIASAIYTAFLKGEGFFCGLPINAKLNGSNAEKLDAYSVAFWEKVYKLEQCLGVRFVSTKDEVETETICRVEELYQNLIKSTAVKSLRRIDAINGIWELKKDIREAIGKSVFFEFEATKTYEILGQKLSLPALVYVFNAALDEYQIKGKEYRLILKDVDESKPRYSSVMCFKNQEALKIFKEKNKANLIEIFRDTKRAYEYLPGVTENEGRD